MVRKIVHPLMALALVSGLIMVPAEQAQARNGAGIGAGIAAGIIGLGILGATAGSRRGDYYESGNYDEGVCYAGRNACRRAKARSWAVR